MKDTGHRGLDRTRKMPMSGRHCAVMACAPKGSQLLALVQEPGPGPHILVRCTLSGRGKLSRRRPGSTL